MSVDAVAGDLLDRKVLANDKPILERGEYVLVVLNRALRGEDNAVIDCAIAQANTLDIGIVVYSELDTKATYASDRLIYFALGALRDLARTLADRHIPCIQTVGSEDGTDILPFLLEKAAAIYTDEDYTVWDRARLERLDVIATQSLFYIDASRLVPTRSLPEGLTTTPAFRKAHGALRDRYAELRKEVSSSLNAASLNSASLNTAYLKDLNTRNFAGHDNSALKALVAKYDINHDISISKEHPPTKDEIDVRLKTLQKDILAKYKWIRNNPALEHSTSELSPYLHFGMVSPHQVLVAIESTDIPKSYTWKFRDEFLTWREWSHYQAFYTPNLHEYEALPEEARQTLADHADDERPELMIFNDILHGNTPDETWNAAQREWLNTGWLHNNLRMYWAKQIFRFTRSPEEAWKTACQLNDSLSLDGRDPATYASMQWAFGNAKKGYSEKPIYGWVSPKSDRAILKRTGMKEWIQARL